MESFSIGGQLNASDFYRYCVELKREVRLYNKHRVFGTNTAKRGVLDRSFGVRYSDS